MLVSCDCSIPSKYHFRKSKPDFRVLINSQAQPAYHILIQTNSYQEGWGKWRGVVRAATRAWGFLCSFQEKWDLIKYTYQNRGNEARSRPIFKVRLGKRRRLGLVHRWNLRPKREFSSIDGLPLQSSIMSTGFSARLIPNIIAPKLNLQNLWSMVRSNFTRISVAERLPIKSLII